jgi:hypothetical protein
MRPNLNKSGIDLLTKKVFNNDIHSIIVLILENFNRFKLQFTRNNCRQICVCEKQDIILCPVYNDKCYK